MKNLFSTIIFKYKALFFFNKNPLSYISINKYLALSKFAKIGSSFEHNSFNTNKEKSRFDALYFYEPANVGW